MIVFFVNVYYKCLVQNMTDVGC